MANALRERPAKPQIGDEWDQPIEEILKDFYSCDGATPGKWEHLLEQKRNDRHYNDVVDSIREHGFVRPLTVYEEDCYNGRTYVEALKFGDGHHRLAAAIDLGLTHIPIKFRESSHIVADSGSWRSGKPIPTDEDFEENQRQWQEFWNGERTEQPHDYYD